LPRSSMVELTRIAAKVAREPQIKSDSNLAARRNNPLGSRSQPAHVRPRRERPCRRDRHTRARIDYNDHAIVCEEANRPGKQGGSASHRRRNMRTPSCGHEHFALRSGGHDIDRQCRPIAV
jgi:hypothetical protein